MIAISDTVDRFRNCSSSSRDDNSLENDVEDAESAGMTKDSKDSDKFSRETPADSPAISSKADTPIPEASSSHDGNDGLLPEDEKTWPSVVDLNTRLRRVISSYQRSVSKKEDIKVIPKGKMGMESETPINHTGTMHEPPLNMQGWDLQQLAMYLLVGIIIDIYHLAYLIHLIHASLMEEKCLTLLVTVCCCLNTLFAENGEKRENGGHGEGTRTHSYRRAKGKMDAPRGERVLAGGVHVRR